MRTALIVFWLSSAALAGGVEYPALGNMDMQQGTLEIWFTPMVDVGPGDESVNYENRFKLFHFEVPDTYTIGGGSWRRSGNTLAGASMGSPLFDSALINTYGSVPKTWERGKVCHIAFIWKDHDTSFFGNGKPMGHRRQAITLQTPLGGRTLIVGNIKGRDTDIILHAVRISNIARTPEALTTSQPKADIYTLLLDRFTSADDRDAEVISGYSGETGGTFSGVTRFVEQPAPGLALFRDRQ